MEWDLRPNAPVRDSNSGTVLGYNQASARYLVRLHDLGSPRWVLGDALRSAAMA